MKLYQRWVYEAIQEFDFETSFTTYEIIARIVDKKGHSNFIGNISQTANYCSRYARKVAKGTYRRKRT